MKTWMAKLWPLAAVLMFFAATAARADGAAADELRLEVGRQEVLTPPAPIVRWAIGDPDLAGVTVLSPRALLLTAKKPGTTSLLLWEGGEAGEPSRSYTLTVVPAGVSAFDNQVQIDIKVVEVSRKNLMDAAFFFGRNTDKGKLAALSGRGVLDSVTGDGKTFTLTSGTGFLSSRDAFNFAWGRAGKGLLATLSALEANGFAYTLAEPSLVALSGQTARFHAGGEIPIPLRTGSGDGSSITIEFKEYGVRLALTPTVLDDRRIWLKVAPEVSELDFVNGVTVGGTAVPGLTVRRTDTSLTMGDGESFVISGLISRNTVSQVDKFPGLGDLPLIGAFFRSTRFDRDDKELMMVVTAHLVRPLARDAQMPALPGGAEHDYKPGFFEMFFQTPAAAGARTSE